MPEILTLFLICAAVTIFALYFFTKFKTHEIEDKWPPIGEFYDIEGVKLHAKFIKSDGTTTHPPLVFIHGASGNLRDQMIPFAGKLEGKADLLFVDRPGHGWSERGASKNRYPDEQAKIITGLMDKLGLEKAIIVGHSFGGAVTASLAINHPEKISGLVFLAPVAYPWPGGVAWYYNLTNTPVIGHIFAHLLALPAGLTRIVSGSKCVFYPNEMPKDYIEQTGPQLVLRSKNFRANSQDLASLFKYLTKTWPKYKNISAPTIIISGDADNVVFPYIHSDGLAEHIKGAELISVKKLGHKPDYIATDIALAAIAKLSGNKNIDLQKMASDLDEQLQNLNPKTSDNC